MSTVVSHTFNNIDISQRLADGYINVTAICTATGKNYHDYSRLDTTLAFIAALSSETGIPASQLVESRKGNSRKFEQGTWVHPQLAIHLAQWCSPEFAVRVTAWVFDWLTNGQGPVTPEQLEETEKQYDVHHKVALEALILVDELNAWIEVLTKCILYDKKGKGYLEIISALNQSSLCIGQRLHSLEQFFKL